MGQKAGSGVRLLDATAGKELHQIACNEQRLSTLAFSGDGKLLAVADYEWRIHVWDTADGKQAHKFKQLSHPTALAFTPDGKALVGGGTGEVCVWDLAAGKELRRFAKYPQAPRTFALSAGGKLLAVGGMDHSLRLWDPATGKEIRRCDGWLPYARKVGFSPDGKALAGMSDQHTLRLWDVATGKERFEAGHTGEVVSVAVSPDGKLLASAGADGTTRLWDLAAGRELRQLQTEPLGVVRGVAFSPDGKLVAGGGVGYVNQEGFVRVWEAATGKEVHKIKTASPGTSGVAFSPDGQALAACFGQEAALWDLGTGKELRRWPVTGYPTSLAFAPDGKSLATGGLDCCIRLWDLATGTELRLLGRHRGSVFSLSFAAEGRAVLSSAADDTARLWDPATGNELLQCAGHGTYVFASALSADGRLLASAGPDRKIRLWDVASGKKIVAIGGHGGSVRALAFAPDGRSLVSGSADTTVMVWDLRRLLAGGPAPARPSDRELESLWNDLAGDDPARAWRAVHALAAVPKQALPFLQERLEPMLLPNQAARLIAGLDSDDFATQEKAAAELEKLGRAAEAALRQALEGDKPSLKARRRIERIPERVRGPADADGLRLLRVVAALEDVGSAEARQLLEALAKGGADARLPREARAALKRLAKRPAP